MQKLSERQSTEPSGPSTMSAIHKRMKRRSQRDRARLDEYASQVMELDESGESFVQKMHRLFSEAGARHAAPGVCMLPAPAGAVEASERDLTMAVVHVCTPAASPHGMLACAELVAGQQRAG